MAISAGKKSPQPYTLNPKPQSMFVTPISVATRRIVLSVPGLLKPGNPDSRPQNRRLQEEIERGVDLLSVFDSAQNTPLHYASLGGHGEVVVYLLDRGVLPLAQNRWTLIYPKP